MTQFGQQAREGDGVGQHSEACSAYRIQSLES
jgi:hypothetical protein